jgi:hypothetical protein
MGTAYEMALLLDLQPELEGKDVETLRYMTRSQDYSFQTPLEDSFFTECEEGFDNEWRFIIANNCQKCGKNLSPKLAGVCFAIISYASYPAG